MLKTLIFCDGCSSELTRQKRWRVQAEGGAFDLHESERQVFHYCPGCLTEPPFHLKD